MYRSKSQRPGNGFILIDGTTKQQTPVNWQWLTQRGVRPSPYQQTRSIQSQSYSEKKSILSNLQTKQRIRSSFQIKTGFSQKQRPRIASTSHSSQRSVKQLKPYAYINVKQSQLAVPDNFGIDIDKLSNRISSAHTSQMRVIGIIVIKRMGLRYKFHQSFIQIDPSRKSSNQLQNIRQKIKKQIKWFKFNPNNIYFYKLSGQPIDSSAEMISQKSQIVIADTTPKLQLPHHIHVKVLQLGQVIEKYMRKIDHQHNPKIKQKQSNDQDKDQPVYDWQRIENVREYVDKISQNPDNKLQVLPQTKNQLLLWYSQKYQNQDLKNKKQNDKNPLFQSKNHYPNQVAQVNLLKLANQKLQSLPTTNNRHKFIPRQLDLLLEHVKRQNKQPIVLSSTKKDKELEPIQAIKNFQTQHINSISKKDLLLTLDKKNTLLTTQNIPYLIEKYGLNRFQLFNLYNLYKSFEKIAIVKHPQKEKIMAKGIDRETFQVGLKGLDMNPGQQLIKNITHFGDYISWQQFIKIISISLRKTPAEKLQAILKGISYSEDGVLSRYEISLMIGNSLNKLFDQQQKQLQEYFTEMAMKQLDEKGSGKIDIEVLKKKVLNKGSDSLNMVSFLILNT